MIKKKTAGLIRHVSLAVALTAGCVSLLAAVPSLKSIPTASAAPYKAQQHPAATQSDTTEYIRKVLFIGDSMTGWMAERFNAYGEKNGFEVATVVWDGSTIRKWAAAPGLANIIKKEKPDAIIVSLGMNELFERNPESRLKASVDKLRGNFSDLPFLWIGPPSWPGHKDGAALNNWLAKELGEGNFFESLNLEIPRQSKSNPHPSRKGIEQWIDAVAEWIPENSNLEFKSLSAPADGKISRGKTFIYKRMKETL